MGKYNDQRRSSQLFCKKPTRIRGGVEEKVPSENIVNADVEGTSAELPPVRKRWDSLIPVPGAKGAYTLETCRHMLLQPLNAATTTRASGAGN
jgi:hypothetical protein